MEDYIADEIVKATEDFIRAIIRDSDKSQPTPKNMMDEARMEFKEALMDNMI